MRVGLGSRSPRERNAGRQLLVEHVTLMNRWCNAEDRFGIKVAGLSPGHFISRRRFARI
jgi:hypothetical protein